MLSEGINRKTGGARTPLRGIRRFRHVLAAVAAGVVWLTAAGSAVAGNFRIVTTARTGDSDYWGYDANKAWWYAKARIYREDTGSAFNANGQIYSMPNIAPGTRLGFSAANLNWRVEKVEKSENPIIDADVFVADVPVRRPNPGGRKRESSGNRVPVALLVAAAVAVGVWWRSKGKRDETSPKPQLHVDWRTYFVSPVAVDPPGGFGTIYNVHPRWHWFRKLKLKILMPKWTSDSLWINQMRVECATLEHLSRLRYDHAPHLVDYGGLLLTPGQGSEAWFVMTVARGHSLDKTIRKIRRYGLEERLGLVLALSDALAELHQLGVVHRDLTPENVFVDRGGTAAGRWRIEFIDFGSAKTPTQAIQFPPGYFIGKVQYSAPEHRADMNQADKPADVYALGVMACEILLGRHPFPDGQLEHPEQLVEQLKTETEIGSALAKYIVWRLLNKEPAQRGTAREFASKILKSHPGIA